MVVEIMGKTVLAGNSNSFLSSINPSDANQLNFLFKVDGKHKGNLVFFLTISYAPDGGGGNQKITFEVQKNHSYQPGKHQSRQDLC